jgi:putative NADH-flavin reductase
MRLTVFGATGRIGGQVVRQAMDAGKEVTAVVRDPAKLSANHRALRVVTVPDLTDPAKLRPALDGSDAAISGIGPRTRRDVTVASSTTRGILRALEATGIRRLVVVTAAPVGPIPDGESWLYRRILLPIVSALLRDVYTDLAVMEDEIERSATDWTIVRPPRLVNTPLTATYRTAIGGNVPRAGSISRADVAHALLAVLHDPATIRQAVGLGAARSSAVSRRSVTQQIAHG